MVNINDHYNIKKFMIILDIKIIFFIFKKIIEKNQKNPKDQKSKKYKKYKKIIFIILITKNYDLQIWLIFKNNLMIKIIVIILIYNK